jgi:endonuclease/exonuclease/phosphatase family metal-dependent hydrolase
MKILKKFLKGLGIFLLTVVLIFGGFLGYMTMKDYKPNPVEKVEVLCSISPGKENIVSSPDQVKDTLTFYTWNIGYCGLGKEQDFFFDGGKMVRPTKEMNQKYQAAILANLQAMDTTDFIFLQEVDKGSKRSWFKDQVKLIGDSCPGYCLGYATNYKSLFVPQPVSNPYGKCYGGLVSLSKATPTSATRFSLAQDASWPTGLFMLKRCYMEFRYPMKDGKELVVINQHLSAYDDGTVKQRQMDTLKVKLLAEYKKGNYVIVGGDWNTYPPGYTSDLKNKGKDGIVEKSMPADYPEAGWKYVFDPSTGSNRKLYEPYTKGKTDEVVIDYFLLSPNVYSISVKTIDLGFENSDHQPVYMKVTIQPPIPEFIPRKMNEIQ